MESLASRTNPFLSLLNEVLSVGLQGLRFLQEGARYNAEPGSQGREGIPITDELYDLILFVTHSFVRPTTSDLYSVRLQNVIIADDPRRLIITIRDGETGFWVLNTMPAAVSVYERIQQRHQELGRKTTTSSPTTRTGSR